MSATYPAIMSFLLTGTLLGLSAGVSPGPLLTLVISETLRHDVKAGIKVAIAPILTDLPIILVSLLLFQKITHFHTAVGLVSFIGGFLLLQMGYKSLKVKGIELGLTSNSTDSLRRGLLVNLLNPYPYLFWFTVGAPAIVTAWAQSGIAVAAYVGGFFVMLVGSKIVFAIVVGKSKSFVSGDGYVWIMRGIGVSLCLFAFFLFRDGIKLTGLF
jgi:threonine/homoserine/homoserine lactone efflux protein